MSSQPLLKASGSSAPPSVTQDYGSANVAVQIQEESQTITSSKAPSVSSFDSHIEPHFEGAEVLRDIIVGLSDGLTVPFALAAGLAALGNSRLVVLAGMAEIVAGAISMGLGGWLAGRSEIEHYDAERKREQFEVKELPDHEEAEIVEIFEPYGLSKEALQPLLDGLKADPEKWVDFMMKFELCLEKPDPSRTWISALTIGSSYFIGGLVPLIPYILIADSQTALLVSVAFTIFVLLVFGYAKARILGTAKPLVSALQTAFIGALASGAAFGVAKVIPQPEAGFF
ncbi:VIT family-domain-containing protein [Polychytrium aggregatum]|uniref:VIT family-domain-containing protein n=1 Tax=Polychytrium aggregatum TaxID=110093 RepID=UPI0022FE1740|nr:VIT family-domain-containing protein [Polychytrium aggregatum]KAI9205843.1 VIT family-domain-containing protein [Polychytrium aggregatum]